MHKSHKSVDDKTRVTSTKAVLELRKNLGPNERPSKVGFSLPGTSSEKPSSENLPSKTIPKTLQSIQKNRIKHLKEIFQHP